MKLFTTGTSPYVRKVLVVLRELGLDGQVEKVFLRPSPTETNATLSAHNPLNKIPALVLDDGTALYDSPVLCEYLESLSAARSLVPKSGPARFDVLRRQALCDGILEAGILVFYELHQRPKELHWPAWISGQRAKARQGLDQLEQDVASFGAEIDLGQICAAVTFGWLEFREPLGDVRAGRPRLSAWYDDFRKRPSLADTEPA